MTKIELTILACIISGCSMHSGVVPIGKDTYMVSRQAATGFTGLGSLKGEAFQEASEYCLRINLRAQVVNTTESKPPYILGNFPRVDVQFMCIAESDVEYVRPKMTKEPDIVIKQKSDINVGIDHNVTTEKQDIYMELMKLDDLRNRKIISEEEFQNEKRKLLNGNHAPPVTLHAP